MALIECYECGKQISSIAAACPHCGAPAKHGQADLERAPAKKRVGPFKKLAIIVFWGFVGLTVLGWLANDRTSSSAPASASSQSEPSYIDSHASYDEVDRLVGCASTFSDDKKDDIFNDRFRNRWMTWSGRIELVEADSASLNIDGQGLQDLSVDFQDKRAGYDLQKGQVITVRFLMKSAGGCFLPYSGERATLR
ncbi:zinc ribbon domain-containing protein [Pseudomonas stutzeri]|jgi:hypothetical protein|nr:zinc ribbon domain-containing protein [Stutzerimonas decontaminans]NCT79880.1 zinc ribbon domain-containing protein [Stutzerimonas stutzeri]